MTFSRTETLCGCLAPVFPGSCHLAGNGEDGAWILHGNLGDQCHHEAAEKDAQEARAWWGTGFGGTGVLVCIYRETQQKLLQL